MYFNRDFILENIRIYFYFQLLGVKYQSLSLFTVIFLSAVVHEYIFCIAFGYFYPILFVQFALLGCKRIEWRVLCLIV